MLSKILLKKMRFPTNYLRLVTYVQSCFDREHDIVQNFRAEDTVQKCMKLGQLEVDLLSKMQ